MNTLMPDRATMPTESTSAGSAPFSLSLDPDPAPQPEPSAAAAVPVLVVDRYSGEPVYEQIVRQLRAGIMSGALPLRTRLPGAHEICELTGNSRVTAEKAVGVLKADGLVRSVHGIGMFVIPPEPLATSS